MSFARKYFGSNRGVIAIIVAAGAGVLFGMVALGVDVGYLFLVRNQLQNAADAGALAGAPKLIYLYGGTSGSEGEATAEAIAYAQRHFAADRPIEPGEVDVDISVDGSEFGVDGPSIRVTVKRTQETIPVALFFGRILGTSEAEVSATAVARLIPAKAICDLRPWAVYEDEGNPLQPGQEVILKYSSKKPPDWPVPGWFSPVRAPGEQGANAYKNHIINGFINCDKPIEEGDWLDLEPGNMVGPTVQGLDVLTASGTIWPIVKIPIYRESPPNPSQPVQVVRFGAVLITDYLEQGKGNSKEAQVLGVYQASAEGGGVPGFTTGLSDIYVVQLIR
ncbi:MAG: pilus assembly protein TadG-related protein [Candidatus Brocadiales bacterium]